MMGVSRRLLSFDKTTKLKLVSFVLSLFHLCVFFYVRRTKQQEQSRERKSEHYSSPPGHYDHVVIVTVAIVTS